MLAALPKTVTRRKKIKKINTDNCKVPCVTGKRYRIFQKTGKNNISGN